MRVVPVIDLQEGRVVRGIAGQRAQYRPVQSALTSDTSPAEVAQAFARLPGVEEIYVADLDAIAGGEPSWPAIEQIAACGLPLWLDAGMGDAERARRFIDAARGRREISGWIVGLESVQHPDALPPIFDVLGPSRGIFSLDLKQGRPLAPAAWRSMDAARIAESVLDVGFRRLIVLDLASVGAYEGGSQLTLCARLRAARGDVQLISGGGVRGIEDLRQFAANGCDAVLVASALHDLRLRAADLRQCAQF